MQNKDTESHEVLLVSMLTGLSVAALTTTLAVTAWLNPVADGPPPDRSPPDHVARRAVTTPWPTKRTAAPAATKPAPPLVAFKPIAIEPDAKLNSVSADQIAADLQRALARPVRHLPLRASVGPRLPDASIVDRLIAWSATRSPAGEIAFVLPGEPLWSADRTRRVATLPRLRWADVGRWLARANNQAARAPGFDRLAIALTAPAAEVEADGPTIHSPPALAGPTLVGPGDRLAMVPSREPSGQATAKMRRQDRQRSAEVTPASESETIESSALLDLIQSLLDDERVRSWAAEAEAVLRSALSSLTGMTAAEPALEDVTRAGFELADELDDPALATRLRRACYAIDRRAGAWRLAGELRLREQTVLTADSLGDRRLRTQLKHVLASLDAAGGGASPDPALAAWRRYLLADRLEVALDSPANVAAGDRRRLASDLARRLTASTLTGEQRRFLSTGPLAALGDEVLDWGRPATDAWQTVERLEEYERDSRPRLAKRIALDARRLSDSTTALHRQLAEEIDQKYRNANFRFAVADEMLERFLPPPPDKVDPVGDWIAGAYVRGRARTSTDLSIRLLPDPFAWRLGLEARGTVSSSTYANPGPVVVRNRSEADFFARKLLVADSHGVRSAPAVCEANSRTRLVGLSSYYDKVPVVGGVIRSRARDEHNARRGVARRQSQQKVSDRVRRSVDAQVEPLLTKLRSRYEAEVAERCASLGLAVKPVEVRTTDQRLIARVRIANDRQLAAHTPRNRAPGDSLASFQVHQSLVNNVVEGLNLGGRRFTPSTLQSYVRDQLRLPPAGAFDPQEPAELVLDAAEPARVILADGRAELVLGVQELVVGRRRFGAFKVHAFYEPEVEGIEARLVRKGGVHIEGRMRTATRAQLHGVFTQALDPQRPITLIKLPDEGEPRLAGLMVTQLVLGDGWLGLAIGPEANGKRVAKVGRYVR